jgi:hypothetical protein
LQIAHLLSQLMAHESLLRQAFPKGVGSAKNLAFRLLEAWRNLRRPPAEVLALVRPLPDSLRFFLTVLRVPARSPIFRLPT